MNANTHSTTVTLAISGRCSIKITIFPSSLLADVWRQIRVIENVLATVAQCVGYYSGCE